MKAARTLKGLYRAAVPEGSRGLSADEFDESKATPTGGRKWPMSNRNDQMKAELARAIRRFKSSHKEDNKDKEGNERRSKVW